MCDSDPTKPADWTSSRSVRIDTPSIFTQERESCHQSSTYHVRLHLATSKSISRHDTPKVGCTSLNACPFRSEWPKSAINLSSQHGSQISWAHFKIYTPFFIFPSLQLISVFRVIYRIL
ncbi:hypothetical protein NPIL_195851 [Nephila pilipes]|uniref:Uncharacterized protein n=1 Tax=Nephila pilipes TaxID=299642 RepID=A0A8X6NH92_NEPPI|nr:hypothetical protein NPIL_195851 [Nephila pilipes]